MNTYNRGRILIILGALLAFSLSIFYISWSSVLNLNGFIPYSDLLQMQSFFWVFLIFNSLNIAIWIYCTHKEIHLSLKGQFILFPFVMALVAFLSVLLIREGVFDYYGVPIFSFDIYITFLLGFDVLIFWGAYEVIKDKII
jgi:apolipoprotein N-acyltransferase